jgi:hypothetical protein
MHMYKSDAHCGFEALLATTRSGDLCDNAGLHCGRGLKETRKCRIVARETMVEEPI